jgi:hypothetical protein
MNDDIKTAAETAVLGGSLGGVAGLMRAMIFDHAGGFAAYVSVTMAACLVGSIFKLVLVGWDINGQPLSEGVQWAIIIVTSIVAKDILTGLRVMGSQFAIDPLALAQRVWNAIRGGH